MGVGGYLEPEQEWFQYAEELGDQYSCKICFKYVTKEGSGLIPKPSWRKIMMHIYGNHKIGSNLKCPDCKELFQWQWQMNKHYIQFAQFYSISYKRDTRERNPVLSLAEAAISTDRPA